MDIFDDKVLCILKGCSDEEWQEYEEKIDSEMKLSELLEDLGKVLEAANKLKTKKNRTISLSLGSRVMSFVYSSTDTGRTGL